MKPSSAKNKGRLLQQYVARRIREVFGLEDDDVQSRSMGAPGEDLMLSPRARAFFPFAVECKNTRSCPGTPALEQAKANGRSYCPVVMWKPGGMGMQKTILMVYAEDFLEAWKENTRQE